MTTSIDAFFKDAMTEGGAGGGAPSYAWEGRTTASVGTAVTGDVVDTYQGYVTDIDTKEPKLNKRGEKMAEVSVTLQTNLRNWEKASKPGKDDKGNELPASEDTGLRRLYFKYEGLRKLGAAITASGATLEEFFSGKSDGSALHVVRLDDNNRMLDFQIAYKRGTPKVAVDPFTQAAAQPAQPAPAPAAAPAPEVRSNPFEATTQPDAAATFNPASTDPPF